MSNAKTTSIEQLRQADWNKLHDDVSERIQLLEQAILKLEPNALNDQIARDLFMPALRLLAEFCLRVEIDRNPSHPAHYRMSILAPKSEPPAPNE